MKLDLITAKQDECYTPAYAVEPILKYVNKKAVVWCPFDTEKSYYVRLFKARGNTVIHSHISEGIDFFKVTSPCDVIISNPPYSLKGQVFARLFELGKPFAMLVGVVGIFESQIRFSMFEKNKFEIMYFNKRISFMSSYEDETLRLNPPFSSVYICQNLLPKQIVFERIDKAKTKELLTNENV